MAKKKRTEINSLPSPAANAPTHVPAVGIEAVLFIVVAILVVYPLFFRALFFPRAMFTAHVITATIFIAFWFIKWKRQDLRFVSTPLDWAALAFAAAYVLSLITAVHFGDALYGCLKALNYFMLYWLVGQVITDQRSLERMGQIMLQGAIGVGIIGVLAASGFPVYPGAFDNGLIYSSLQYHNATAAFLAAMSILSLALLVREDRKGWQLGYSLVVYLLQVIVFATLSKGAWLTLAAAGVILVLGMPSRVRIKTAYFLGMLGTLAFIVGSRFLPAVLGPRPVLGIISIIIGLFLALAVFFLWEAGRNLLANHPQGKIIVAGGCALLILMGAFLFFSGSLGLSKWVLRELAEIVQSDNSSYVTRVDFLRWGLDIVKDYPIFGAGAGGWEGTYHRYQDYLFWTTQAHNHFMQVWVEAGTLGLFAFVSIWLAMFWSLWSIHRQINLSDGDEKENVKRKKWILVWGCAASVTTLGLHASMDFDLSLPALSMIWFALMAMINRTYVLNNAQIKFAFSGWLAAGLSVLLGVIVLYMGTTGLAAFQTAEAARDHFYKARETNSDKIRWRQLELSADQYQKAVAIYPWKSDYFAELSAVYAEQLALGQRSGERNLSELYQNTVQAINQAHHLSPGDMDIQNQLLNTAVATSHLPLILERLDASTAANPLDVGHYETRSDLLWMAAEQAYKSGDPRAVEYCQAILQIPVSIFEQQSRVREQPVNWQGARLKVTSAISLNVAKSNYLLGRYQDAAAILAPLLQLEPSSKKVDSEFRGSTQAFYAASLQRQGQAAEAQAVLNQISDDRVLALYDELLKWAVLK